MRQTLVIAALLGVAAAMPQQRANPTATGPTNTNVRILNFESFQDGANFGHQLFQEDGTTSGQKYGPDGLLYGFYSYINPEGTTIKVFWRAGQGVGYEVIGTEGLIEENLGNLRATITQAPPPLEARPRAPVRPRAQAPTPAPVQAPQTFIPVALPTTQRPPAATQPPRKQPASLNPNQFIPVVPSRPLGPTTPEPQSNFDFPATLNIERTHSGFFSSLTATR